MANLSGFKFRLATEADRPEFINLARLAFAPTTSQAEFEQEVKDQPLNQPQRKGWVVEDAATNRVVARYRHLELSLFFEGALLPMAGVGGVAVAMEHRGQGIAQWMLEQALQDFREQQLPISMLYPFQHGFYRSLGWAWVGKPYQYRVATRSLPAYPERSHITRYEEWQEAPLKALYEQAAQQHNGWLQRTFWWEKLLQPKGGREIFSYIEAGKLLGYVALEFKQLEPTQPHLAVVVQEWVAMTAAAYRGIVGFLASLRDQVSTVVWNTSSEDPFPYLLKEQRQDPSLVAPAFEFGLTHRLGAIGGGFMWRLVDIKQAIALRPIRETPPFALSFQVLDPILGKEHFTIEFRDRQMALTQERAKSVLHTSVDHLTELFCGLRRSRDLLWTGELEVEGDDSLLFHLDAAWQAAAPFCWDFF